MFGALGLRMFRRTCAGTGLSRDGLLACLVLRKKSVRSAGAMAAEGGGAAPKLARCALHACGDYVIETRARRPRALTLLPLSRECSERVFGAGPPPPTVGAPMYQPDNAEAEDPLLD
jgi:hypothetical protein